MQIPIRQDLILGLILNSFLLLVFLFFHLNTKPKLICQYFQTIVYCALQQILYLFLLSGQLFQTKMIFNILVQRKCRIYISLRIVSPFFLVSLKFSTFQESPHRQIKCPKLYGCIILEYTIIFDRLPLQPSNTLVIPHHCKYQSLEIHLRKSMGIITLLKT